MVAIMVQAFTMQVNQLHDIIYGQHILIWPNQITYSFGYIQ